MGKVKESIQNVYDECTALYEKGGVGAVCDHVIAQQIANNPMYEEVKYGYCMPCEAGQPCLNGICLVCGSPTEVKPVVSAEDVSIGQKIHRLAELRYLLEGCDDHDLICIETIDLETGDTEDLYPMYVDVIDGIKLTDGTIVREVRFCQMPNSEPDTRDKQPLVDAVIEQLKSDLADGDCTVLDELLMKLPWEILKGSLPEDQWERFNPNKSFEDAKRLAIAEAKRKIEQGKLFKSCDESKESEDFTNGDPETLFSLASLYAQFVDDDFNNASDALYDALLTEFPEYE